MFESFTKWYQTPNVSFVVNLISFIVGVVGLYIGYISIRRKSISYACKDNVLITDFDSKINGLEIKFKGHPVKDLTITKLALWNSGNTTINHSDIVQIEPIQICSEKGIEILECSLVDSKDFNQVKVLDILNKEKCIIYFDYIDKKEGAIFQLIHTGKKEGELFVSGKIKSVNKIIKKDTSEDGYVFDSLKRKGIYIIPEIIGRILYGSIILLLYWLTYILGTVLIDAIISYDIAGIIVGGIFIIGSLFGSWKITALWFNPLPRNLKLFFKEK